MENNHIFSEKSSSDSVVIFFRDYSEPDENKDGEGFFVKIDNMIKNSEFLSSKKEKEILLCKELLKSTNLIATVLETSICVRTESFLNKLCIDIFFENIILTDDILGEFRCAVVYCNSLCFSAGYIRLDLEFDKIQPSPFLFFK